MIMKSMPDMAGGMVGPDEASSARRLGDERPLWSASPEAFEVLAAGLELVGQPVMLMNERGRVVVMNGLGRAAIDRDRSLLEACAARVLDGTADERIRSVTTVAGRRASAHHLLVLDDLTAAADARLERARVAGGLTVAETRVLGHVVRGDSNKDISRSLKCAVRTVEVHVTSIFRKCGAESRARLVAWFWTSA